MYGFILLNEEEVRAPLLSPTVQNTEKKRCIQGWTINTGNLIVQEEIE
jgi:hypothetical protein